jgi:hypothetical protein
MFSLSPKRIGTGLNTGVGEIWATLVDLLLKMAGRPMEKSNLGHVLSMKAGVVLSFTDITYGLLVDFRCVLLTLVNAQQSIKG